MKNCIRLAFEPPLTVYGDLSTMTTFVVPTTTTTTIFYYALDTKSVKTVKGNNCGCLKKNHRVPTVVSFINL